MTKRLFKGLFLVLMSIAIYLMLPIRLTMVNYNLDDIKNYFASLEIQSEKTALQDTLPSGERVMEVYEDQPKYVQVQDTCNWAYAGDCVIVRTEPDISSKEAHIYYKHQGGLPERVREGQVFPVSALIKGQDGSLWYKIAIDKNKLLFPERIKTDWYVPADHFSVIDFTPIDPEEDAVKKIVVILHEQTLYAYEGDNLYLKTIVSTGRENVGLGTTPGKFHIYKKLPMTVMDGPLPSMVPMMNSSNIPDFEYTLFVPFAMAYNPDKLGTAYIHGTYWHNGFGTERSHGCVNVNFNDALTLYNWTPDPSQIKIPVTVLP